MSSGPKGVIAVAGVLLCLVLCVPLFFAGGGNTSTAAAAPAAAPASGQLGQAHRVDLAPALAGVPAGGYSTGTFPWGQCTYWAAFNRKVTWNGDAWQWVSNAAAQGATITATPAVGEIVVYDRGHGYDSSAGHVALVVASSPSSYTISEMHYVGLGVVDTRTIAWPDSHVLGFIA